jgi:hypothetical protein
MMKRLTAPAVQTRLAALVNAVLALLFAAGVLGEELIAPLLGVEAALAAFLSAWYDPRVQAIGPTWLDEPR